MKLKKYNNFVKNTFKEIESLCDRYNIRNYSITEDGVVNVDGDVSLEYSSLYKIPLTFGIVNGRFDIERNNLISLEGSPRECVYFYCGMNGRFEFDSVLTKKGLTSLKGCPDKVESFWCNNNDLTSLEYISESVITIACRNNQIRDFKGVSEFFEGEIACEENPVYHVYKLFETSKCIKWLNEFEVIRGNTVVLDRLEEVYHQLNMEPIQINGIECYEVI